MKRSIEPAHGTLRALAFASLLVPVAALADPPAQTAATDALPSWEQLDANHDGIVTLPEVVVHYPALAKRIARCDSNGDKTLSRQEYAACRGATPTPSRTAHKPGS